MDTILSLLVPIHREGHKFIAIFALVTVVLFMIWDPAGWMGVLLTFWCVCFFRDPDRKTPTREGLVISPADGVVNMITKAPPPPELGIGDTPVVRVSVFMNVFNCHVNRIPVAGRVTHTVYHPGKFLNASLDKASEDNERHAIALETADGKVFSVVQIAGLVARRILNHAEKKRSYEAGERFGLIRFGSRVDVYLPAGMEPLVAHGQKAIAGETVLADMRSSEPAREAAVR